MTRHARGLDRALPLDPERVADALEVAGPTTVQDIASVLRARPRAVWARLRALEAAGRVRRAGVVRGRGRPAVLWEVAP